MKNVLLLLLAAAACGCSAPARYAYTPVAVSTTTTTSAEQEEMIAGVPAVAHPIPPEAPQGAIRVAMFGPLARTHDVDPNEPYTVVPTSIHIALVVSNLSDERWSIDRAEQRVALGGREAPTIIAPTFFNGEVTAISIPPRSTRWLDLSFMLPSNVRTARELPSFEVQWTIRLGDRAVLGSTPFTRFAILPPPNDRRDPVRFDELIPNADLPLPGSTQPDRRPRPLP